ncbi:hypothetical protein [Lentzea sp.]|uniref:hypothetical protein n=1 Tax=Lentzea sp. TaxID=56099 RepID=UPI002CEBCE08|nr:hypothetical protein [Lentzea sp.]HUQ61629.1 hypothetical protein [Lentzea sp.]
MIFAIDIEDSTTRTNAAKGNLRRVMYELFDQCMQISGVREAHRDPLVDRGDGILALIHAVDEVPKTLLLDTVVPLLATLLTAHAQSFPDERLRMRSVLHAGEVHHDGYGCFGESIDVACRLLEAPDLKQRFREITEPLILIVSNHIHETVVRHGYQGIDESAYLPGPLVRVGAQRCRGWIHVPSGDDELHRNAWPLVRVHSQPAFRSPEEPRPFQLRPPVLTEERSA